MLIKFIKDKQRQDKESKRGRKNPQLTNKICREREKKESEIRYREA